MQGNYQQEFPDFGLLDVVIPAGFKDDSWHNNACPSFTKRGPQYDGEANLSRVTIWVDHADEDRRECGPARFAVVHYDKDDIAKEIISTSDWTATLAAAMEATVSW